MKLQTLLGLALLCVSIVSSAAPKKPADPRPFNLLCTSVTPMSVRFGVAVTPELNVATIVYTSRMDPHDPQAYAIHFAETGDDFVFSGTDFSLTLHKANYTTNGLGQILASDSDLDAVFATEKLPYTKVNCVFRK